MLESYVTKKRDKKAALKFMKKLCVAMDRPTRSPQICYNPSAQQQKSLAVQTSKLHSDGQITEPRIHTYPFDNVKELCYDLGVCTASKSSLQPTPHFTITSTHKDPSASASTSSSAATPLLMNGNPYRLIERTLPRLVMIEPICLTALPLFI